jgi:hypothetical protein
VRPLAGGHTRLELLGRTLAHPILLAPVAYQRMAHPDGELATALAASAQGAGLVLSTQASLPSKLIAQAVRDDADRGPLWFQLYLQHDRGFNLELIRRAEAAGYEALVLTVDAPATAPATASGAPASACRRASRRSTWPACRRAPTRSSARPERPLRRPAAAPPPGTTSPGCRPTPACRCS